VRRGRRTLRSYPKFLAWIAFPFSPSYEAPCKRFASDEGALKINFDVIEPNAPPVKVQGHNTSSTSIWVGWDTVPVADQNGIILSYTVTYTVLTGGIPRTAVVGVPTTHVTLRSLEEYTNYSIFVFASTMKGDGNSSAPIMVTTDQDSKSLKNL